MDATLFDGKRYAQNLLTSLAATVATLPQPPRLAVILVGENEGSIAYIKQKQQAAAAIGAQVFLFQFIPSITTAMLAKALTDIQDGRGGEWEELLMTPTKIGVPPHGIIVQRPLPSHISVQTILNSINPQRDIDGFHRQSPFLPPVGMAVVALLSAMLPSPQQLAKKTIVLIGHGETAGAPIAVTLARYGIHPKIITAITKKPRHCSKTGDIVITAVGKPGIITKQWIKPGAIVIDVGISRKPSRKTLGKMILAGDCAPSVRQVASILTPVPGGVGPVNVACLMQNLVSACQHLPRLDAKDGVLAAGESSA